MNTVAKRIHTTGTATHTGTYFPRGQHKHNYSAGSKGRSLSFVDGTKHFFVIQLLNSNLIKATREVFIPLVQ